MASTELTGQAKRSPRHGRPSRSTYVLIRGTGLLLVVLALGHFALTHIITDVAETDGGFIGRRWANVGWVIWDAALLLAALAHAGAGLRAIIRDYAPSRARALFAGSIAILCAFFALGVATLVIHQLQ